MCWDHDALPVTSGCCGRGCCCGSDVSGGGGGGGGDGCGRAAGGSVLASAVAAAAAEAGRLEGEAAAGASLLLATETRLSSREGIARRLSLKGVDGKVFEEVLNLWCVKRVVLSRLEM